MFAKVFLTELRKSMAYRVDFWLQLVLSLFVHIGIAYFMWDAIFTYKDTDNLQGYSFLGMMLYYVIIAFVSKMVQGNSFGYFSAEIYNGEITKYLIYPVSIFMYKLTQSLANNVICFVQLYAALILFLLVWGQPVETAVSWESVLLGSISLLLTTILGFFIFSTVELVAFWADNVWTLIVMTRFSVNLLGGGLIPLAFFPEGYNSIMQYLPFSCLTSLPIHVLLGKVAFNEWLFFSFVTIVWIIFFYIICSFVWIRGQYKYTGVGI